MELSKAVVADVFAVSRSAVTQSTKNKTVQQDVKARIIRFVFNAKRRSTRWDRTATAVVSKLYKQFKVVAAARAAVCTGAGRPVGGANFTAFKRLVREVLKKLELLHVDGLGLEIQKELYRCLGIDNGTWYIKSKPGGPLIVRSTESIGPLVRKTRRMPNIRAKLIDRMEQEQYDTVGSVCDDAVEME